MKSEEASNQTIREARVALIDSMKFELNPYDAMRCRNILQKRPWWFKILRIKHDLKTGR